MAARIRVLVLFALALAPSAYLAWTWRAMPQLGLHHDDALYLVSAKSLAEGNGYRIASLPGQPYQTKYPPLFSALLIPLWKYGPGFPANLPIATFFAWLMLPAYLVCVHALFRQFGFSPREVWALTIIAGVNPIACLLSTMVMSDLLFMALLLACILLAEKALNPSERWWLALCAGVIAGVAYLTRTSALPLLFSGPLCFALRKQWRRGLLFAAGVLPAVAGWQMWVARHIVHTRDFATIYYTNYMGLQLDTVRLDNLLTVLWYNFDGLLRDIGKLILFDVAIIENPYFERIIGVAAVAGAIRLVRRSGRMQYPAFAAGVAAILLGYHYIADQRISFPLYPLVLMGFWTEAKNLLAVLRAAWNKRQTAERVVAGAMAAAVCAVALFIAAAHVLGDTYFLPKLFASCKADLEARRQAYAWVAAHTAPDAAVYAYDDPVLYLYTGRRSLGLPVPPRFYYEDSDKEEDRFALALPDYARAHRLEYLLLTPGDFYRDLHQQRARMLLDAAARNPELRREYDRAQVLVYRRFDDHSESTVPSRAR